MTPPELKPCPFCGGIAVARFQLDDIGDYRVVCDGCGASACPQGIRYSQSEAITDWNTRATQKDDAIKNLNETKQKIIKCRDDLRAQGMWMKFDEIWKQYTSEIESIDAQIKTLLSATEKEEAK